jgi:endonuclease III
LNQKREVIRRLLALYPQTFPEELGIDLSKREEGEVFKWFLASLLFGARISMKLAARTYKEFEAVRILTPEDILRAGWDRLVEILDEGGYVRYDFKTATRLLDIAKTLTERCDGRITRILDSTADYHKLVRALEEFKGVGPVTVNIFLRELRDLWPNANPPLQRPVILTASHLGLISATDPREGLEQLRQVLSENRVEGKSFAHLEDALLRYGKNPRGDDATTSVKSC